MVRATTTTSAHDTGGPNLDCGVLAMVHAWKARAVPTSWKEGDTNCRDVSRTFDLQELPLVIAESEKATMLPVHHVH